MKLWLMTMLSVQLVISILMQTHIILIIASLLGILCVWQIANGQARNFIIGIISSAIFAYVAYLNSINADMLLQIGYIVVDIFGIYQYTKGKTSNETTNNLTTSHIIIATVVTLLLAAVFKVTISHIWLDSLTGAFGILAMYLTAVKYKHTFVLWLLLNVLQLLLWFVVYQKTQNPYNLSMVCMYTIYFINSIIGFNIWKNKTTINPT